MPLARAHKREQHKTTKATHNRVAFVVLQRFSNKKSFFLFPTKTPAPQTVP
jgi:hypothetical protein